MNVQNPFIGNRGKSLEYHLIFSEAVLLKTLS